MYTPIEARLGVQPIAIGNIPNPGLFGGQTGQSPFFGKQHPLGTIIRAYDPVYGEGEFIYLQSFSGQDIGDLVMWSGFGAVTGDGTGNEAQFQAAAVTNTANLDVPVAVAMDGWVSGAPATMFGWFQIAGHAVMYSNGTVGGSPPNALYISSTAGFVTSTQANGKQILNCRQIGAASTPAFFTVTAGAVVAGGSGYQVGDVLGIVGGTNVFNQALLQVATLSGNAVATVTVFVNGTYGTLPSGTVSTTGGHGTGATFTLTSNQPYVVGHINRPAMQGQIV